MKRVISNGQSVTVHYRATLGDGTVVDDTLGGDPLVYVQGSETIVPGLERGLAGMSEGDVREIVVEPADGYGILDPSVERSVARAKFPADVDLEPGMYFEVEAGDDVLPMWVKELEGDQVVITQNHPLAGETLTFNVRVIEVREATAEEVDPPET
ncbi:MAG: peptidylprolyl isomerase [Planctomycetota bacterium]